MAPGFSKEGAEVHVRTLICVILLVLASGCTIGRDTLAHPETVERRCGPASLVHQSTNHLPTHIPPETANQPVDPAVLAGRFSSQSQRIAESLKVKDLLVQLIALEAQGNRDLPSSFYRLQVQQQLSNRILLVFLDVARTAARQIAKKNEPTSSQTDCKRYATNVFDDTRSRHCG